MSTEESINIYFACRYNYLVNCANKALRLIQKGGPKYKQDLVTEAYTYIVTNKEKLGDKLKLSGTLESIVVNWMNKQIQWSDTHFKKEFIYEKGPSYSYYDYSTKCYRKAPYIFLDIDEYNHDIKEDENQEEYHQELAYRYNSMLDKMSVQQRCLFDIVYIKGNNTTDKLYNYFKDYNCESRTSCYYMLKDLREWIKNNK